MNRADIKKVCVLGAGTMGGGIAADLVNLGFDVALLDATQEDAQSGLDRLKAARPPAFYLTERANDIRLGNIADHLHWVSDADWVCEAIVENAIAKRELFARVVPVLKPDCLISSNTSGIPLNSIGFGLGADFNRRFLGIHFFNPPRYLKLVELIPTATTDPDIVSFATDFLETSVAKRVVLAQDKPGFIANRFGMWNLFHTIHTAERLGLTVEQVDEISGTFLGRPKSATFRLADIIGLDVMRDIANNLKSSLTEDPKTATFEIPNSMLSLLGRGWIGDKTGHGYYRREGKETLVLDFATFAYRMPREVQFPDSAELNALPLGERLAKGLDLKSEVGEFLREALIPALVYADELKAQVSHSVADFDNVMKWGFGWEKGPFELIDCIGSQKVWPQRVEDGPDHPYYKQGSVRGFHGGYTNLPKHPEFETLHDFKQIEVGETYRLRDMGNGVIAIVLTSKMGVLSPKVVAELKQVFGQKFSHYVLTSEAKCFSAGFDIQFLNQHVQDGEFHKIEEGLLNLQELGELMQTKPGATAIFTYCLGAGLELALSSHTIVADAESQIGLPESRLGLIPGGRGVCLMRQNNAFNAKRLAEVTLTMAQGTISSNADHAKQLGYLRNTDKVVYDRDRLFFIAKQAALDATVVAEDLWKPALGPLVGMIDELVAKQRASGAFTEYDEFIAGKLRQIVARSTSYQDAIERERTEFVDLAKRTLTQTRLRHMLDHGTALRN